MCGYGADVRDECARRDGERSDEHRWERVDGVQRYECSVATYVGEQGSDVLFPNAAARNNNLAGSARQGRPSIRPCAVRPYSVTHISLKRIQDDLEVSPRFSSERPMVYSGIPANTAGVIELGSYSLDRHAQEDDDCGDLDAG